MNATKKYLSLVKFAHTIFAMPFAMIGFFIGVQDWQGEGDLVIPADSTMWEKTRFFFQERGWVFLLVLLCMVFARNAAMAFNRYLDRKFDAQNPRTAVREIPSGILSPKNVLFFAIINVILFMVAAYFINKICFYLSPIALLVILGYSYTKRFTALCHIVLGVGLSLAPIGAYLAVTGEFSVLPVLISLAVVCWVSGFDIIYALQDEEFDVNNDLHSIPAWLGKKRALVVSSILHLLSTLSVVVAGISGHFGALYWIGVAVFIGMLIYQHSIVKPTDLRRVNLAFMTANGIASVVFALLAIAALYTDQSFYLIGHHH